MKNSIESIGNSGYWLFGLICVCGVVLVLIAVLALLLIKGQTDSSSTWKLLHAVAEKKNNKQNGKMLAEEPVEVQFFRIGRDSDARKKVLKTNRWCSVGSSIRADFCLDSNDNKLAEIHFRIYINRALALVAAADGETFVNGVPIRELGEVPVRSGDLIRAGNHEYRIIFSPCEEKENSA